METSDQAEALRAAALRHGFRAITGNPPYQASPEGERLQATPIFHHYNSLAGLLQPRLISLIYPAKWMFWSRGEFGAFSKRQFQDGGYRHFRDFPSSLSVFEGVEIAGGICFFLIDRDWSGSTYYSYQGEDVVLRHRILDTHGVRDPRAAAIVEKLDLDCTSSMSSLVGAYGHYLGAEVTVAHIEAAADSSGTERVYYLKDGGVALLSVREGFLRRPTEGHKVFVSKTANPKSGSLRRADRMFTGGPKEGSAVSFLRVGPFSTAQEAHNCEAYLRTDLCNFLVGLRAVTHNTTSATYSLVPGVDFKTGEVLGRRGALIDFNLGDLDQQLAQIFGITESDQAFIRSRIKPWPSLASIAIQDVRESSPS